MMHTNRTQGSGSDSYRIETPTVLTGRYRFRQGYRKRLVLQVECRERSEYSPDFWWRDARPGEEIEIFGEHSQPDSGESSDG